MSAVPLAATVVPERHYTHHEGRGETPHRSNPVVIHRELTTLDVLPGMHVAEVGTGSGYSGALLAELVGPEGAVTSLDIDAYLSRWAGLIHHQRGVKHVRCHNVDGTAGYPDAAPYDRLVAWCTPPLLPDAWVDQVAEGGLIVAPLPIAAVPNMTVVVAIRVRGERPVVEEVFHGGYIEATVSPKSDLDLPGRWVDWENRVPVPSWISIGWRREDDHLHTGARNALNMLMRPEHTEAYGGGKLDVASWRTFAASWKDHRLTVAGLGPDVWGIGHSTPTSAAVIQQDGTIVADSPESPSLVVLRDWLQLWEEAGRPAPAVYTPTLLPTDSGWDLRLSL